MRAIVGFLFMTLLNLEAFSSEKVIDNRWKKLMDLSAQEIDLLEKNKKRNEQLNYRLLELYSERLKLLHEKNNRDYLEQSVRGDNKVEKESFFQETRKYYEFTKAYALELVKKTSRSNVRAEVFYVLALNSRDYGKDNITEKYLKEVLAIIHDPYSSLRHHVETALADFYYNEKRYSEAIHFYQRVIKKQEDEWLSKHYYNLSWCLMKNREFEGAINAIITSYKLSKDKAYIDIRDQVLPHIGTFFVFADRTLDGMNFYLENEKDPVPSLFQIARKSFDKGLQNETEKILETAQKIITKKGLLNYQEEAFHTYLDFFRQFNRFGDHESTARRLVYFYLKFEAEKNLTWKFNNREETIEKLRSAAGFLQIQLGQNNNKESTNLSEKDIKLVLNYFSHLMKLDPQRTAEYKYFQGETFYSVKKFLPAANSYVSSVKFAEKKDEKSILEKSLTSLLALTSLEVLPVAQNKQFLVFAYSYHIKIWPRNERSEKIYTKLFEIYLEEGKDVEALKVLASFKKAYPEFLSEQQILMTKIIDLFIDRKDTQKLAFWTNEIRKGYLSFQKEVIEKVETTLGVLLFKDYQKIAKEGNHLVAAKGFESIFNDIHYTEKIKAQSAFYASITYLDLAETQKSHSWQKIAWDKMEKTDRSEKRHDFLKMAERTYKLQDFTTSLKMSLFHLEENCQEKDDIQTRYYEIAIMTSLMEKKIELAENTMTRFAKCLQDLKSREAAIKQMFSFYEKINDFRRLRLHVYRYPSDEINAHYRSILIKWFWQKDDLNLKDQIKRELISLKHEQSNLWLKEIDKLARAQKMFNQIKEEIIWDKSSFEAISFNRSLESYLLKVQSFKNDFQGLLASDQIDLVFLSLKMFQELFRSCEQKILGLRPLGMAKEVEVEFLSAMKQLAGQFKTATSDYDKQFSKVFTDGENLVWVNRSVASVESIENPVFSFFSGLTMDKAGGL